MGAAHGCVPSPMHCPVGIIQRDAAFLQLKDEKVPQCSADLELNLAFLNKCMISCHLLFACFCTSNKYLC